MTIEINPKEHKLTINTQGGTREAIGHLAQINKFPVMLHIKPERIQKEQLIVSNEQLTVSDVKSGCIIANIDINIIEFWQADTKDKALQLFEDKLEALELFMTKKLINEIKEKRSAFPEVKAPEPIEDYEAFVKEFMEAGTK